LKNLKKQSPAFHQFIEETEKNPRCQLSDLESLLILPVQRVPQYNMLFAELLKYTWKSHPEYKTLKTVVEMLRELGVSVNEKKREAEKIKKVRDLEAKVLDFEVRNDFFLLIHSHDR